MLACLSPLLVVNISPSRLVLGAPSRYDDARTGQKAHRPILLRPSIAFGFAPLLFSGQKEGLPFFRWRVKSANFSATIHGGRLGDFSQQRRSSRAPVPFRQFRDHRHERRAHWRGGQGL
jgi:hypothetical protein